MPVAYVVCVRARAPANKATLTCHEAEMLLRAYALWFAKGEDALVDLGADLYRCPGRIVMTRAVGSAFRFDQRDGALLQVA